MKSEFPVVSRADGRTPLRVLLVEDSDDDAALVVRELERGGFDTTVERVMTREPFRDAMKREPWDVIISDYSLPDYGGLRALEDARDSGMDIPFILVSGTVGETVAVQAMQAGAKDYVLKGHLARLCPVVAREIREARRRAEQRRMREQLIISDRMATAGTLAAGVAHEINNPLAVVIANLDFIHGMLAGIAPDARGLESRGDGPRATWTDWLERRLAEADEPLRDAKEAVTRIREIVRDVKLFSRPSEEANAPVDVERVIESSIRMAWNEIRHRALVVREYGRVPRVDANEARLGQALLNLIVNAAQAIPEGDARKNEIRVTTRLADRDRVAIEIRDSGVGISKENIGRIFDPFFTTKPVGLGTGLGLAICRRLVVDMGGEIAAESEPGKGACFRLTLPIGAPRAPAPAGNGPGPDAKRRARILIVDDEEALARALKRALSRYHDVSILTSGKEASARIAGGERFDVILSDLMMPEVTGMDMYRRLKETAPEQAARMVFLTGGAFTARARAFLDEVANPRIEKPVELASLLRVVADVLS
jgi:signal transduction histidine kinase